MAVSHVKSNPVANMTGTVTVFNSAGVTTTAAATDLVRPLDWNSAHNQFMTISGNTAGASTLSGTNIVFQGAGAVTLSGNADTLVFSAPTQTAFVLSNSNGISFGTNGSTVTASHNGLTSQSNQAYSAGNGSVAFQTLTFADSNGVSFSTGTQGLYATVKTDYLTTAALSNHSHGNPTLALTNLSGTTASNSAGLTLSLSAAAPGGAASVTMYATGNTTQSSTGTQALSSMLFQGTGGISAGISNGSVVISGPEMTSLAATGALSASSNGSTISLGVGTVTASAVGNTTQTSSGTVNLNGLVVSGAGGLSAGFSNGTLILSGATGGGGGGGVALSAGTQSVSTGTVAFANSNGLTFGMSGSNQITASYNSTQFAGTGTTFAGANISASMTLNSAGLNLSASVAAPGAAAENNAHNLLGANTAGNTTATGSTIGLSGLNLTLSGTNASQIVISAPATSSLVGVGGISLSTNGSTISISRVPTVFSRFVNENAITTTGLEANRSSVSIVPFMLQQQLDMSNLGCMISLSGQTTTNNSTNGAAISISGVLYSLNGSSLSSINSASNTYTGTWSSNATASVFGARALTMNLASTTRLDPGEYWWAIHVSSATTAANTSGTSNLTHAFTMGIGAANLTQMLGADPWGQATAATRGASIGLGILSTGATLASIAVSDIQQTGSRAQAAKLWLDMRNYSVW